MISKWLHRTRDFTDPLVGFLGSIGLVIFGVALVPSLIEKVNTLGVNIGISNTPTDYILGVLVAIILMAMLWIYPFEQEDRRTLIILWLIRCSVTLVAMLFYEYYYGLDAFYYHTGSAIAPADPFAVGGTTVILYCVHWLHRIIPMTNSYHATKVICSFIGFIGGYIFYKAIKIKSPQASGKILSLLCLFPTVLFWSSILGKDPIHFFALSLYFYGLISYLNRHRLIPIILVAAGIGLASIMRVWSLPILLLPLLVFALVRHPLWAWPSLVLAQVFGYISPITDYISTKFKIETVDDIVNRTQMVSHSWATGGSGQEVPNFTSLGSMINFLPFGMFTALFRPMPGEIMNPFGMMAGCESLVFLVLVIWAFGKLGRRIWTQSDIFISTTLVIIWSAVYAFISYQNLGSGYRFRLQAVPFLLYIIIQGYLKSKEPESARTT